MKNEVTAKGLMTSAAAIAVLEDLLASLKSGKVVVQSGDEFVTVKPTESIEIEIGAARKKGKEKVFFEMSWLQEVPVQQNAAGFKISAVEPVIEEPAAEEAVLAVVTTCNDAGCASEVVSLSVAPETKPCGGKKKGASDSAA